MSTVPACAGQWRLFDSVDANDHRKARTLCGECPLIAACRQRLALAQSEAYNRINGPRGTWAGELLGGSAAGPVPNPLALAAEERMFTDDEARAAHAAFVKGDDSDRARIGERVYQRRMKRRHREKRAEVAA